MYFPYFNNPQIYTAAPWHSMDLGMPAGSNKARNLNITTAFLI